VAGQVSAPVADFKAAGATGIPLGYATPAPTLFSRDLRWLSNCPRAAGRYPDRVPGPRTQRTCRLGGSRRRPEARARGAGHGAWRLARKALSSSSSPPRACVPLVRAASRLSSPCARLSIRTGCCQAPSAETHSFPASSTGTGWGCTRLRQTLRSRNPATTFKSPATNRSTGVLMNGYGRAFGFPRIGEANQELCEVSDKSVSTLQSEIGSGKL